MRWALGNLDNLDGGKVYNTRLSGQVYGYNCHIPMTSSVGK